MKAWQDLVGGDLTAAEVKLIEACLAGVPCALGEDRPDKPSEDREIRAPILKALITGGLPDQPTTDIGVYLKGAYVSGQLNLWMSRAKGLTRLGKCRFEHGIVAQQAQFESLNLSGSHLPALNAQGALVAGDVFLRDDFHAAGEVSLAGARIGGQLACSGARFENPAGHALLAQGARANQDVFLSVGFYARGAVSLAGAEIGGQLNCKAGRFENPNGIALLAQGTRIKDNLSFQAGFYASGEVSVAGAQIGGQMSCKGGQFENPNGRALLAQDTQTKGGFYFRDVTVKSGSVDLSDAHVGTLCDDLKSWPKDGRVILDGFTYDRINGAPTDSATRLQWLERGDRIGGKFSPQPYTQLARVLRNMGHERAARDVLVARGRKIAAEEWTRARPKYGWSPVPHQAVAPLFWAFIAKLSHLLIDYGHRPLKAVPWLVALWLIAATLAQWAWIQGDMVPNSDVILTSDNWAAVYEPDHPSVAWGKTPEGQSWETFNSLAWGMDLVVPILDLGQTQAWTPSTNLGFAGQFLWGAKSFLTFLGWIVLAFAAAGVTGVARRQD